jgi:hypothetical protein
MQNLYSPNLATNLDNRFPSMCAWNLSPLPQLGDLQQDFFPVEVYCHEVRRC